jgi:hypothetical protein
MARRKGKKKVFYDPDRAYDDSDRGEYGKEPKMRQPKGGNVVFEGRIKQKGLNEDTTPASTAIDYVAYNPGNHKLYVKFAKGNAYNSKTYVFHEVPIEDALDFLDSPHPRKQTLPDRENSLGASFRKEIREAGFNFSKQWAGDSPKESSKRPVIKEDKNKKDNGKGKKPKK